MKKKMIYIYKKNCLQKEFMLPHPPLKKKKVDEKKLREQNKN